MLCLTRRFGESVLIEDLESGHVLQVTVRRQDRRNRRSVRLAFDGPREMVVTRTELTRHPLAAKEAAV